MIKWYPTLLLSNDNGLLKHVKFTGDDLVICLQGKEYRQFAMFSPLYTFVNHILKTPPEERCFYEVIMGNSPQKVYFDIDISDKSVSIEKANEMVDDLKRSILLDSRIKENDILVFSSHGVDKKSFHIIVNNWCLPDYNSNKVYCHKVIDNMKSPLKIFIDLIVYKNLQQLRTFCSTKRGADRFKILTSKHDFNSGSNQRVNIFNTLLASLVTNTKSCKILEYTEIVKRVYNSDLGDISDEDISIVNNLDFIKDGTFTIGEINGRIVPLKRNRPSHCRICDREHQNENPFLVFTEHMIIFHCRRTINDGMKIWTRPATEKISISRDNVPEEKIEGLSDEISEGPSDEISDKVLKEKIPYNVTTPPPKINVKIFMKNFLGKK